MLESLLLESPSRIYDYLQQIGFLHEGEGLRHIESAGEGNMNITLRATTDQRTFIVKQSPPWVAKYPDIPAPAQRVLSESAFYQRVARSPYLSGQMPALLWVDAEAKILILEDVGCVPSCTDLYQGARLTMGEVDQLTDFLVELHAGGFGPTINNMEMRTLNHHHIFGLPLATNNPVALDEVCPGLAQTAKAMSANPDLRHAVHQLGELYLVESGSSLLHGDFHPGSWLRTARRLKVIDPEFCFHGPPEFDVGVLMGHLVLCDHPKLFRERMWAGYGRLNRSLTLAFAGVEILRRLLGVAQLPLRSGLSQRVAMLKQAELWALSYAA